MGPVFLDAVVLLLAEGAGKLAGIGGVLRPEPFSDCRDKGLLAVRADVLGVLVVADHDLPNQDERRQNAGNEPANTGPILDDVGQASPDEQVDEQTDECGPYPETGETVRVTSLDVIGNISREITCVDKLIVEVFEPS